MSVPAVNHEPIAIHERPHGVIDVVVRMVLMFADTLSVLLPAILVVWVRHQLSPVDIGVYVRIAPSLFLFPMAYGYAGLYPGYGMGPVEQIRRSARSTTLVTLVVLATTFLFQTAGAISRPVFVAWWMLSLLSVPLFRSLVREVLSWTPWWGNPVIILGAAKTGRVVAQKLRGNRGLGLRPVAFLDDDPGKHGHTYEGVPVLGPLSLAPSLADRYGLKTALVAMPGQDRGRLLRIIQDYAVPFPQVLVVPDLLGLSSLCTSARDLQGVLGLEVQQNLLIFWNRFLKRCLDLAVAIPVSIVASLIVALAGLAVKLVSPGPVFYAQDREGLGGRRIKVWKVRTMVTNAEAALQVFLERNPESRREWEQFMKLKNDPRVIPYIGTFLRRFSIDELPQLWNILCGEMSLVGPRPFPDYHLGRFPTEFRVLRQRVKPGLTGLWQVTARSDGDLAKQEELDTYYIRNWSLWLDLYLLFRTVAAVLFAKGAY